MHRSCCLADAPPTTTFPSQMHGTNRKGSCGSECQAKSLRCSTARQRALAAGKRCQRGGLGKETPGSGQQATAERHRRATTGLAKESGRAGQLGENSMVVGVGNATSRATSRHNVEPGAPQVSSHFVLLPASHSPFLDWPFTSMYRPTPCCLPPFHWPT